MARCYIVPSSQFVPGRLGEARRWEQEKERIERREAQLHAELATIPAKKAECEAGIAASSLERWRIN